MPEESTISTMRAGESFAGTFACVRKERLLARNGSPYLNVELRDATGSTVARAFRDADVLAGRFEEGEIVRVRGRVQRFRDELQLELAKIERVELPAEDLSRFLPSSRRDLDELEGFLEHLVREIYEDGLRGVCERLLRDPRVRAELRRAPCGLPGESGGRGSGTRHHAYLGGLLEHTVGVATLALELCTVHPRLDRDLLLAAAILHDVGRTREFSYGASIERTEEGRMLGHVELGLRMIGAAARSALPASRLLALEHCVAMHHGGGGEVRFASAEAVALARANALDADVKGALERGLS